MGKYSQKAYNKVKAINERIADVARTYGQNSEVYRDFEKRLTKLFPESAVTISRKGNIRLKQGRKDIANINKNALRQLDTESTSKGKYTRRLEKEYTQEYGEGKPTKEQLIDYSRKRQRVKDAADNGTIKVAISEGGKKGKTGTKRTYEELNKILDEYEAAEAANMKQSARDYLEQSGEAERNETQGFRTLAPSELDELKDIFNDF